MADTSYMLRINNAPAGRDLLDAIALIEVSDDAGLASAFRLRLPVGLTDSGEWTWVADDMFKPLTPVAISVQLGTTANEQLIRGYITSHRIRYDKDPGASYIEVLGVDESLLMNIEEKIVAWKNLADSDIVTRILNNYGFTPKVENTQPSYAEDEVTTMQRGTDLAFVRRMARRNGFEFFLETDAAAGITTGHFHKPVLSNKPQKDIAIAFGEDSNVRTLELHYDALRPTTMDAYGLSVGGKSDQNAFVMSSNLDTIGGDAVLDLLNQQPKSLLSRGGAFDNVELRARAQAAVNAASWAVSLSGELDATSYQSVLRARRTVLVKGAGARNSGTYYVSRVVHTLTNSDYTQKFELVRNALALSGTEAFTSAGGMPLGGTPL